jgi:serine/threonine-protein kinase HipA
VAANKRGKVYIKKNFAGIIEQKEGLYSFTYDEKYLNLKDPQPVSLTLPLRKEPYDQKTMIAFFDGLIPEGWLLNIITDNWKINPRDRMSLLLLACKDCIGDVSVLADKEQNDEESR